VARGPSLTPKHCSGWPTFSGLIFENVGHSSLHPPPWIHSLTLIAVQPSFSTFRCKTLNIFIKVCYSLTCISSPTRLPRAPCAAAHPLLLTSTPFHSPYTLPSSVSLKPRTRPSYATFASRTILRDENCRGVGVFFPFWFTQSDLREGNLPLHSSPFFSNSCALFCTHEKLKSFTFKGFRTLCEKPPGVGEVRLRASQN
jgi:hypothetical protein